MLMQMKRKLVIASLISFSLGFLMGFHLLHPNGAIDGGIEYAKKVKVEVVKVISNLVGAEEPEISKGGEE
jgi:hypothetical protein